MHDPDELAALDDQELSDACLGVDWRAEEEEIIEGFAGILPDEDLEAFWSDEAETQGFRLGGREYLLPLTFSPVDRYVAIGSLASVLGGKYEVRLLTASLETDTHDLLVLPHAGWKALDERHGDWTRAHFQPLQLGKDYFGGGEVPYIQAP